MGRKLGLVTKLWSISLVSKARGFFKYDALDSKGIDVDSNTSNITITY